MSFNKFLAETILPHADIYEEIGKKRGVNLVITGDHLSYGYDARFLSPDAKATVVQHSHNPANMLELLLIGNILTKGPKVFEAGQLDMEMLIHTDLNVLSESYRQPFETCIIQLPESFCKNRVVNVECVDYKMQPGQLEPDFCVIHHDKSLDTYVFAMFYENGLSIKSGFSPKPDVELESLFIDSRTTWEDSLHINDAEWKLFEDLFRASLNYFLMLDQLGMKKLGPTNPKHHARLREQVAKNNAHSDKNRRLLKQIPIRYVLDQQVKLRRMARIANNCDSLETNNKVSPHHRRGHYRNQKCGVGFRQTKRIWIPPIFVNAELFLGKMSDTKVTYN